MSISPRLHALRVATVGLLLAFRPATALAQTAPVGPAPTVLRLDDLLRRVDDNPNVRAARLEAEALGTRRAQVGALPDPTLVATYRPFGLDAASDAIPGLQVQQAIPYPGKRTLRGDIAGLDAQVAVHQADALRASLILQIKETYYDLYHIQQHDAHVQRFQQTLAGFEEAASVRYEVGQGTQQAILKAQIEKNELARERLMLADQRRTLLEALARLTNQPALAAYTGNLVVEQPAVRLDTARALTVALQERPEASALRTAMRGADTQIELARREFLPDFMLEAGFMDMGDMNNLIDRFSVGVGIVLPLQTGRRRAALEEARIRRAQAEVRYEALQTDIQTTINAANEHLRQEGAALTLYQGTLIPQAESALESTLSAYTTGRADFLDLLDTERTVFRLHIEKEETLAEYLKAAAVLEHAIGVQTLDDPLLVAGSQPGSSPEDGH